MGKVIKFRPKPQGQPSCMRVAEVAYELGLSQTKVYDMLRKKELPSVRAGSRWLIPREALENWLRKAAR